MTFIERFCFITCMVCFILAFIMSIIVVSIEALKAKRKAEALLKEEQESAELWRVIDRQRRTNGFNAEKE